MNPADFVKRYESSLDVAFQVNDDRQPPGIMLNLDAIGPLSLDF